MLDYKDIITKHYALGMSGRKIAESLKVRGRESMTSCGHSRSVQCSAIRCYKSLRFRRTLFPLYNKRTIYKFLLTG